MEPSIKTYKKQFDRDLRHVKIILSQRRRDMAIQEWLRLVQETKESILTHPEEYFCSPLPSAEPFCQAVEKVFAGFLEDQRLLALQTSKGFKIPAGKNMFSNK
ncbi:MAG: hypothetical protein WA874_19030 [Chryseosolibacter sp.]